MAIYRPPKARWPLVLSVATLAALVGLGGGLLLTSGSPDPASVASDIAAELDRAAASLEVAGIEYAEAVGGGSEAELQGARDALSSSRARYEGVARALVLLAPERAQAIESHYSDLAVMMSEGASANEVAGLIRALDSVLRTP